MLLRRCALRSQRHSLSLLTKPTAARAARNSTPSVRIQASPAFFTATLQSRTMSSSSSSSLADEFQKKLALGKTLPPLSDNMAKLEMYALFKQSNVGKNTTSKPGMLDFVVRMIAI